jgi:protein-disulfide isomerase
MFGMSQRAWRWQLGIVVGLAIAFTIVAVSGCSGTSPDGAAKVATTKPSRPSANGTGAEVISLLAGIPQRGNTLGDPNAPVAVQFFGDLECPFCRRFTLGALRSLIGRYVRGGKLKIEYRSLQTATRDPETFEIQQIAALAAGKQNKMWNYIELFYHEQGRENSGYVTEGYLQGLAQQVSGLNLIAWTAARADPELASTLTADARAAADAGATRTPTFLLRKRADTPYASAIRKLLERRS